MSAKPLPRVDSHLDYTFHEILPIGMRDLLNPKRARRWAI